MRKVIFTVIALALFTGFAFAQWEYVQDFAKNKQPHGIVVDTAGKIWIGYYAYTDTIKNDKGNDKPVAPIWVYDNVADTEPTLVTLLTIDGKTDTLDSFCRGLSLDNNGNVLFTGNQMMYRINYQTFEGMNKYLYPAAGSLTSAGCDANGYIYVTKVVPSGAPTVILDTDFELYGYVIDSTRTIQRSIIVSPDGNDVYLGTVYSGINGVRHYHSDNGPDGPYALVDTLGSIPPDKKMAAQCLDWDPWGMMWVGTYWDVAESAFSGWYVMDPKEGYAIKDSIGVSKGKFTAGVPADGNTFYSPRHVAFLNHENMWWAFTCDFDGGVVKLWKNPNPYTGTFVVEDGVVVRNFVLKQNYPNPFNPTTTIPFQLEKNGFVELKVYNIQGSLVKTLVSEKMTAGSYTIPFSASDLSSGTYYYRLTIDGKVATKAMTLVK